MKFDGSLFLFSCWLLQCSQLAISLTPPSAHTRRSTGRPDRVGSLQDMDFMPTDPAFVLKTLLSPPDHHHPAATAATATGLALAAWTVWPQAAVATGTSMAAIVLQSSLVAYAHILSILAITGCLVAERLLFQTDMTDQDEDLLNRIDAVYGLLAALLIGSGFAQALHFGKGGDFYIHQVLFWVKMTLGGIWGGLSVFPTLILRQRRDGSRGGTPSLSEPQVKRIHSIINAEISAICTIPLLASLISHGVGYYPDFPWQAGAAVSTVATIGSFLYYGRQGLTWSEVEGGIQQKAESDNQLPIGEKK